jgi:outer membrane protein
VLIILLFAGSLALQAQQITRFAVVDLVKVYEAFFRDSRAVRELNERRNLVQAEVDRMLAEIQQLDRERVAALGRGDRETALRLESEIYQKTEYVKEYYRVKTLELEAERQRLAQSNDFLEQVNTEIRYIAESEGYSMVLSLTESNFILWYSPSVDITDKVINSLLSKVR